MNKQQKLKYIKQRLKELERIAQYDWGIKKEVILVAKMRLMDLELRVSDE